MLDRQSNPAPDKVRVIAVTGDADLEQSLRSTFGSNGKIDLSVVQGSLLENETTFEAGDASVVIVDLIASDEEMAALQRLMSRIGRWPPVIVVTQAFSAEVARRLVHMRVADFLVKPVNPIDFVRACARVAQGPADEEIREAQIYTFLPAAGGVGVTTIAIQTAMTLLNSGPRGSIKTCLVDLDFQHGACADYLDLEPRLDLGEIEPRPERLDRQLLGVMLSQHSTGLALIAAPNRPAEMRSFDPNVVTRLLDLVSSHFDYVVIDMPRTWFSWTDSVLVGSNKLFIISEMTVPGPSPREAARYRSVRAARPGAASAGHREPFRAAHVRFRPAPRRHQAGTGSRVRRHASQQLLRSCARRSTGASRSRKSRRATTSSPN